VDDFQMTVGRAKGIIACRAEEAPADAAALLNVHHACMSTRENRAIT